MSIQPLVSIGVPTYNRPLGLRKTLLAILNQDYENIEVIVSDNSSTNYEVEKFKNEFESKDTRIKFFIQEENKGALFNFHFVQKIARGEYFMWAADDDEWQGSNFLSTLMKFAPDNILTFPDATIIEDKTVSSEYLKIYENCKTQIDYTKNFCVNDSGYPFYGVYNLKLLYKYGMSFSFEEDMVYHSDGIFLHKLFLAGPVKFIKEATIVFNAYGSVPSIEKSLDSWTKYIERTLLIYANADLPTDVKNYILNAIMSNGCRHYRVLLEKLVDLEGIKKPLLNEITTQNKSFFKKGLHRIKQSIKFLLFGTRD